ncbi:hypothetical protein AQJ23_44900 [Streptomyces antibioticus]|nr:hypothetical protein [Streptomyces antibioticus]KUN16536.1 hypothetical protein AQJ23_44900 [Streptomyces antibioticus]
MHIGRSFGGGGHIEASCPCELEPCGLVDQDKVDETCNQHPPAACKTMRSGHSAEDCPGIGRDVVVAIGKTEAARQAVFEAAAMEPQGFVNASLLGALDDYRAAVEHEAAERIRAHEWDEGCAGVGCCADTPQEAADFIDSKESE